MDAGKRFWAALVYYAAGVCGLLSLIPALNGVDSSPYMVYPAAILLCTLLWASFCYRRPLFYLLLVLILLGEGVTAFLMWDRLWEQGTQIAASLAGETNLSQMTVTLLVMTVMPLLALFLFLLEFILRKHLLVCLLPFLLDYRRLRRLKKMKGEGCRKVYARFLQMLHFCGCMKGWDGTEPDLAKETAKQLSWMKEEEICKMQDIVSQAAFGPSQPQEEQETFVYQVYCKAAQGMLSSLKWHKRLIFCFFKAYA